MKNVANVQTSFIAADEKLDESEEKFLTHSLTKQYEPKPVEVKKIVPAPYNPAPNTEVMIKDTSSLQTSFIAADEKLDETEEKLLTHSLTK